MTSESLSTEHLWRVQANAEYQKVTSSITALATAALVLPPFFLRDMAGIKDGEALWSHLSCAAYFSWALLCASIASGLVFQYVCAKWIKRCHGGETRLSFKALEVWLDWTFWLAAVSFFVGIVLLVLFATTLKSQVA